jgi:hypothetical protein
MERKRSQPPDPLKAKGSATRKGKTSPSALTYWSGIIQSFLFVNIKNTKGLATRLHEQYNGAGYTHGCLCNGTQTQLSDILWGMTPQRLPVAVDVPVTQP